MGETVSADHILQTRGVSTEFDAFVVAATYDRAGQQAAFGLGDGSVRLNARSNRLAWITA